VVNGGHLTRVGQEHMRINLKRFRRWNLLALTTAVLWSMGPACPHARAEVIAPAPVQINQLGRFLALET